ncbi:MBL fold metallo-hydrolase [Chryseobacterium chendengshani]|nr:MBL fold metallo-hydrolase [Chryseobacterium sp. LJ668]QYK18065.1 MBL fold metallo-hydrolase [Chryseobacterium sp. LJ668]
MKNLHHLNCLKIVNPINDDVIGHCLLIENEGDLIMIDVGIGMLDTKNPSERLGDELIEAAGFMFDEDLTAFKQIKKLGLDPNKVKHCVISHLDPDHIGALADFPNSKVHVSYEEYENFKQGNPRYLKWQILNELNIYTYSKSKKTWFEFEAREVTLGKSFSVFLIPLFGHTIGHCGIAIKYNDTWLFYIGDAYYLREELYNNLHPVNQLAQLRADNDSERINTLKRIKNFISKNPEILVYCYHDRSEFDNLLRHNK